MPELPEVEVTRRGIAAPLLGARVLAARLGKPLRWPLGRAAADLAGVTVGAARQIPLAAAASFADGRSCRR
jgi:formamidopyrimidine-DNA glycosylase